MPGEGFAGANVTVPHKGAALAVADELSETAREIGAANTLIFADGEIRADNTDADGLLNALPASPGRHAGRWCSAPAAPARAVVWALVREGAEVEVWNRTELRSAPPLRGAGREAGRRPRAGQLRADRQHHRGRPARRGPLRGAAARRRALLRGPDRRRHGLRRGAEPRCWRAAADAGADVVDGIEVLVQQGALSFRIWTGREAPLEVMRAAARA